MLDLALVAAIAITAFALFLFVYIRENAIEKKLKTYERAIDQIYQMANKKDVKQQVNTKNSEEFNDAANLIIERFKMLMHENAMFKENIIQRMTELENMRNSAQISTISPSNANYEAKIIGLFESGLDSDSIADHLRISVGEVELALNLNGFKR